MAGSRTARASGNKRSRTRLGVYESTAQVDARGVATGSGAWAKLPAILLLVGSLWVLYTLFTDVRFQVRDVAVEGTNRLPASEIRRVANLNNVSSFWVNGLDVTARLKDEFGLIDDVSVTCRLPNRVVITVSEREAVLVWESGGRQWWVDASGEVLGETNDPSGFVVIHDTQGFDAQPEDYIAGVPWQLALEMAEALPAIREYDYTSELGLVLYVTPSQWPVYLGHEGNARTKAALMQALAQQLLDKQVAVGYIDLRNEGRPTYKQQ
ncbi:MAG: FtsQ-type POTRA domain-containing protein [Chloroflexi bacterium]|jgi:cell division septal protein FtsQ|nr:FtsQ-type POTRA domain-containing protein [Chloroflexota bacterium]